MTNFIEWIEYLDDGTEAVHKLPAKWVVCPDCHGEGSYPDRRLSPKGDGSWTGSEMAEFQQSYPDMAEEYFNGSRLRQDCETCGGRTTVQEVDWQSLDTIDPKLAARYAEHLREEARYERQVAAERAMGA